MKRISILIITFVLFAIPAWAIYQSSTFGNRSGIAAGGASCTTDNDSQLLAFYAAGTSNDGVNGTNWKAQTFIYTPGGTYTATAINVYIADSNSDTGSFVMSLWTVNGSHEPDEEISGTTVTILSTDISDYPTFENKEFAFSIPQSLSNGVEYAAVWRAINSADIELKRADGQAASGYRGSSGDSGSTWSMLAGYSYQGLGLYGCDP